jgi:hypothetical protein
MVLGSMLELTLDWKPLLPGAAPGRLMIKPVRAFMLLGHHRIAGCMTSDAGCRSGSKLACLSCYRPGIMMMRCRRRPHSMSAGLQLNEFHSLFHTAALQCRPAPGKLISRTLSTCTSVHIASVPWHMPYPYLSGSMQARLFMSLMHQV